MHPAAPVGGKFHGHPGWSEGIYECSLGGVASWTDVQGGLSTSYCESSRSTGVSLRIHHLLQQICQKTTKNGMGGRTEVDHKLSHPVVARKVSPLVLVYPRELLTSYWARGIRGISSMLDTGPRLSFEVRLRCSSGPPERTGGDAPMPVPTSTEPQLFLPLSSLSRPNLDDTVCRLKNLARKEHANL